MAKYIKSSYKNYFLVILFSILISSQLYNNCSICLTALSEDHLIDIWGNKFHKQHENEGHYCNSCSRLISEVLTTIQKGNKISSNVQDESKATYASKITTQDAKINWTRNGKKILQKIRAFNPWPGAWFQITDERIQIYDAVVSSSNKKNTPGKIEDDKLSISCGKNELLHPKVLQRSGKN